MADEIKVETPLDVINKEIDELLAKAFPENGLTHPGGPSNEKAFDEVSGEGDKSTNVELNANGGDDVIKNKDKKNKGLEKLKAEDKDGDEDEDEDEEDDKKPAVKKGKKMKKSNGDEIELSDEEVAMIEAKRVEVAQASDPIMKSLAGVTDLVKKLATEVETLRKSPAREPKSITGLAPVEKGEPSKTTQTPSEKRLMKSKVTDALFELQKAGKVQPEAVCEYEFSGNIQNPEIKRLVQEQLGKTN